MSTAPAYQPLRLAFVSTAHIHAKPFIEWTVAAADGRAVHAVWDDVPERGRRHAALAGARFEPDLVYVDAKNRIINQRSKIPVQAA